MKVTCLVDTGGDAVERYHYDPRLGRWLQRDPLGYVDGMSLYQYVGTRPISFSDAQRLEGGPGEPSSTGEPRVVRRQRKVVETGAWKFQKERKHNWRSRTIYWRRKRQVAIVREYEQDAVRMNNGKKERGKLIWVDVQLRVDTRDPSARLTVKWSAIWSRIWSGHQWGKAFQSSGNVCFTVGVVLIAPGAVKRTVAPEWEPGPPLPPSKLTVLGTIYLAEGAVLTFSGNLLAELPPPRKLKTKEIFHVEDKKTSAWANGSTKDLYKTSKRFVPNANTTAPLGANIRRIAGINADKHGSEQTVL